MLTTKARMKCNNALARRAAAESMVLLKNDGALLPLAARTKAAIFGIGQIYTVKGGSGSGEVNNLRSVNFLDGLRASLDVDERLAAQYTAWAGSHPCVRQGLFAGAGSANCNEEMPLSGELLSTLAEDNSVAIVVLSRIAGEGEDLAAAPGTLLLTGAEEAMLAAVTAAFRRTVLVLNTAGYLEIAAWLPRVQALVFAGLPGQAGGDALADVLTGTVAFGGKLCDSWPLSLHDFPCDAVFGKFLPSGNLLTGAYSPQPTEQTLVPYSEDIFVGYRYFDSFGKRVLFPFGFGLSIGEPILTQLGASVEKNILHVTATVQNASAQHAARETVQVYVSAPEGRLEKPYQELHGFAKTPLLAPGQSACITISFPIAELASFDPAAAAYILEPGLYYIRVGNSSRSTTVCAALQIGQETVVRRVRNLFAAAPDSPEILRRASARPISYPGEAAEMAACAAYPLRPDEKFLPDEPRYSAPAEACEAGGATFADYVHGRASAQALAASLSTYDLCRLVCGQGMDFSGFLLSAPAEQEKDASADIFAALAERNREKNIVFSVPGEAGQSPDLRADYGIPPLVLADGPAGLRLTRDLPGGTHQYCTAFPAGSLLSCSFDEALLSEFGEAIGMEMEEYGVDLWLAPGMNIHRSPLCGRNFEYFSEDPLLTGLCAAAITGGVQRMGGGVTVKHFAGNNQEFQRGESDDRISERALREIYLRGFELCVRRARPLAVMTGYNDINGVPNADSRDLCTYALRDEWGFDGLVMTDWGGGASTPAISICAGNDMIQPGGMEVVDALYAALERGESVTSKGSARCTATPTRAELEKSAAHILSVIARCKCAVRRAGI